MEELESQLTNNMMPKEVDDAFNELMVGGAGLVDIVSIRKRGDFMLRVVIKSSSFIPVNHPCQFYKNTINKKYISCIYMYM